MKTAPMKNDPTQRNKQKKPGKPAVSFTEQEIDAIVRQAVGTYEAAALMGVTPERPAWSAARKRIASTRLRLLGKRKRTFLVYDGESCEADYRAYRRRVADHGGTHYRRPRSRLADREVMLPKLAALEVRIDFADVMSVREAARMLGIAESFVTRMVRQGRLVGRRLHSEDFKLTKRRAVYIISRRSCVATRDKIRGLKRQGYAGMRLARLI